MTDKNIKYLKKDYLESNYFQSNFNSNSKLVEIKQVYDLTNIFLKQLESLLNISCSVDEISNLHNKLDENLKVYDQKFRINQISNHFYDMPDAFKNKRIAAYADEFNITDQLDMQYHDLVDGTTTWKDAVQAVKDAHPKP